MTVYVSSNFKPNRWHFYKTFILAAILGGYMFFSDSGEKEFALWVMGSDLIYLIVGVIIIYFPKISDSIFGLSTCPSCKKNTISVKEKLKVYGKPFSKCHFCKKYFSLPWYSMPQIFLIAFSPLLGLFVFQSFLGMFLTLWFCGLLYLFYYGRYLNIVAYKT